MRVLRYAKEIGCELRTGASQSGSEVLNRHPMMHVLIEQEQVTRAILLLLG